MRVVTVTAPTNTPVSITEARDQCALLDDASHDTILSRFIASATASIEKDTGMRLMTQTVRIDFDGFPDDVLDLGVYPVQSVTSVVYDDADGVTQTLSTDDYWVDVEGMYPRIIPNELWPAAQSLKPATVRVTLVAGYASADDVPQDVRMAILLRVSELFDNRNESVIGASVSQTANTVSGLVAPHRRHIF